LVARHGAAAVEAAAEALPVAAVRFVGLALANSRAWRVQQSEALMEGGVQ
jgi:hypothetical protein